jgi:hypothetical protein
MLLFYAFTAHMRSLAKGRTTILMLPEIFIFITVDNFRSFLFSSHIYSLRSLSLSLQVMQGHGCTPAYSSKDFLSASLMSALRDRELGRGGAASLYPGIRNPTMKKIPRYQVN